MIEFATVTAALGAVKTISEIAKNVNNAELTQKIIELQNSILALQQQLFEMQTENLTLKQEKRELQDVIAKGQELVFAAEAYWRKTDGAYDGPYCPMCWDADHRVIRLGSLGVVSLSRGIIARYYCAFHRVASFNIPFAIQQQILVGKLPQESKAEGA
jgi:hypothetical protein